MVSIFAYSISVRVVGVAPPADKARVPPVCSYGEVLSTQVAELEDVTGSTVLLFVLLGAAVLILGIYPNPMLNVFHQSVAHLLKLSITSKI